MPIPLTGSQMVLSPTMSGVLVIGGFDDNKNLNEKFESPYFLAPEMFDKKAKASEKTDGWSCGVIIYLLVSG